MRLKRLIIVLIVVALLAIAGNFGYRSYLSAIKTRLQSLSEQAKAAGDWPALERVATEWAKWEPDRQQPWIFAAAAAQEMSDPQRTIEYLIRVPGNPPLPVLMELASLQYNFLNQPLLSIKTCENAVERYPEGSEAHARLLFFYAMTRQRGKLIHEARRAIDLGADTPETFVYLIGADWLIFKNGSELNRQWLRQKPRCETFEVADIIHLTSTIDVHELIAIAPDSVGKSRGEFFQNRILELLSAYPNNMELLSFVIAQNCQHGDSSGVAKLMSQAPPESIDDSRFWRFKGWFHSAQEQWQEAKIAYEKGLQLYPYDWQSQHELAAVLRRTQDFDKVEKYQEMANLGKQLVREVLQAPRTDQVPAETYDKIIQYAQLVGDEIVAKRLQERLAKK